MIKLERAMILWSKLSPEEDKGKPDIKVVAQGQSREIVRYDYLSSSSGSCYAKWSEATDVDRAGFVLALSNIIAAQEKIPFSKIHEALMEIEEYAEFHSGELPENDGNPFWKLYYAAV